jgi:hypothetical protein
MMRQQRLPFEDGENVGRMGQLPLFSDTPASNPQPQPSEIGPKVHPGQFQMFMTPREIRGKYQALEGDRQSIEDDRGGAMTRRPETTAGDPNITINTGQRAQLARWHGGASQVADYTHQRDYTDREETDDELFARKLDEAQMSPAEYRDIHGGSAHSAPGWETLGQRSSAPSRVREVAQGESRPGVGTSTWQEREGEANDYVQRKHEEHYDEQEYGPSLYERISEQGVLSPVHLSYAQLGHTYGKNQIVGGHHRLAVQEDLDPDQPIPVQHWRDFSEARHSGKYT